MRVHFLNHPGWRKQLAGTSAGLWSATALSFLGTLLVARGLGVHGYGQVVLAMSAVVVLATFLDLPLEEGIVFHGQRHLSRGDFGAARSVVRIGLALDCLMGLIFLGVSWAFAGFIASVISREPLNPLLLRITAFGVFVKTLDGTTGAILLLAGKPALRAASDATEAGVRLFLIGIAATTGNPIAVIAAYAGAAAIGSLLQGFLAFRSSAHLWRGQQKKIASTPVAADLLRFGAHTATANSVFAARSYLAPLLLGRLAGPAAAGILDVAHLPVKVVGILTAPARLAMLPEQVSLWAEGRRDLVGDSVKAATRAGLMLGIPGAVLGWVILPAAIRVLYSGQFAHALWPARLLLLVALVHLVLAWSKSLPAAMGRPHLRTIVALVELLTISIGISGLRHLGALGAAIAIAGASILGASVWFVVADSPLRRPSVPVKGARKELPEPAVTGPPV